MDFITDLPPSKDAEDAAYDSILVIMDRYTKMALYIPTRKTVTAEELAQLFVHRVVRSYGVPKGIVSDGGAVFTRNFWSGLCCNLGVKRRLSTAFHPQTDGQTVRDWQSRGLPRHTLRPMASAALAGGRHMWHALRERISGMIPVGIVSEARSALAQRLPY